jgi:hypothetical protein
MHKLILVVTLFILISGCKIDSPSTSTLMMASPTNQPDHSKEQLLDTELNYLLSAVPEIGKYKSDMIKINSEFKLIIRTDSLPDPNASDRLKRNSYLVYVGEDQTDHTVKWNSFYVNKELNEILVEDLLSNEYITLNKWRENYEIAAIHKPQESIGLASKLISTDNQEYCKKHMDNDNDKVIWKEDNGSGYDFWSDGNKHLKDLIDCGWDINSPNKYGKYPLTEALEVYNNNESPDGLKSFLEFKPKLDVKDAKGHDMYVVALAIGTLPDDIVNRFKDIQSIVQQKKDEQIVQMTMHGSKVSTEELENMLSIGIDINEDLTDYSYIYNDPQDPDYETGTILGSAIRQKDLVKVKWLLEHGADANRHFGTGEFDISPLKSTLDMSIDIAELLLKHHADPNEIRMMMPGSATLSAYYACDSIISELLYNYGGTKWYYESEGEKGMELFTKEQVLTTCKKVDSR